MHDILCSVHFLTLLYPGRIHSSGYHLIFQCLQESCKVLGITPDNILHLRREAFFLKSEEIFTKHPASKSPCALAFSFPISQSLDRLVLVAGEGGQRESTLSPTMVEGLEDKDEITAVIPLGTFFPQ